MVGFFNVRLSLWARSVLTWWAKISVFVVLGTVFLLNTVGVALFVFQPANDQSESNSPRLVEAGAVLLILFGLAVAASVVVAKVMAHHPRIDRIMAKTVVLCIGAGLLMLGQAVRLTASFFIWQPSNNASAVILSKPVFYATGWGFDILILVFYAITRIDILFSPPLPFALIAPPRRNGTRRAIDSSGSGGSVPLNPFVSPMEENVESNSRQGRRPASPIRSPSQHSDTLSLEKSVLSVTPERESPGIRSGNPSDGSTNTGQPEARNLFIAVHRTFSVSSKRLSS